jgi:hypothetical protein
MVGLWLYYYCLAAYTASVAASSDIILLSSSQLLPFTVNLNSLSMQCHLLGLEVLRYHYRSCGLGISILKSCTYIYKYCC